MRNAGRVSEQRLPRRSVPIILGMLGLVITLLLPGLLPPDSFEVLAPPTSSGAEREDMSRGAGAESGRPDLSTLNVRLSTRPIHPPEEVITRTVVLPDVRGARPMVGEPTRAAILEDDARRRVVVLSDEQGAGEGPITAYLLYEFDLERYLPRLTACAWQRRCAQDRTPGAGGLGCVAMCLVQALRE